MPRLTSITGTNSSNSSSSSSGELLGYISGISTYDYRSFDFSEANGGSIAVWRKGSNELALYTDVKSGTGGAFSAVSTATTVSSGVDTQGYYQCAMNDSYIYLGRPFANSNDGRLDVYSYSATAIGSRAEGSPNTGAGYLTTNNFGFARIAAAETGNNLLVQDGYTGHRAMLFASVTNISPNGVNIFTSTTTSLTRFTRGYALTTDNGLINSGSDYFYLITRTPSINDVDVSWFRVTNNSIAWNGRKVASGNSGEVQRHQHAAWNTTTTALWAGTGSGAGTQAFLQEVDSGPPGTATLIYSNDSLSSDGSIAIQPGRSAGSAVMISAGKVFVTPDATVAWPNTQWTEVADLLDLVPGITATRGLTRWPFGTDIVVMGTNSGRIHVFNIKGILDTYT